MAAGVDGPRAGSADDRRVRAGSGRVPADLRAGRRRSDDGGPNARGRVREGPVHAAEPPRSERGLAGLRGGSGERDLAAAVGAGPPVLRLPDRGRAAGVEPGRPRPLHAGPEVRQPRTRPGAAPGEAAVDPQRTAVARPAGRRTRGAGPEPGDAGLGLRRRSATRGTVLAADRRRRSSSPDASDQGGDDEGPPRACGPVLRADGRAAVRLPRAQGDDQPGPGPVVPERRPRTARTLRTGYGRSTSPATTGEPC